VDLEVWTHDSYVVAVGVVVAGMVVEDDSEILDSILRWRGYMTLRFLCNLGIRWWLFDMGRKPVYRV